MANHPTTQGAREHTYDAIVIGSGISGGWAAKELCEAGLRTLVLERGRDVQHLKDYPTALNNPWDLPHRGRLPQSRTDLGDAPRVQDVLLAALAKLPVVVLAGESEGVGHERRLGVRHVREQVIHELLQELAVAFGGVGERCGHAFPHGTRQCERRTLRP